MGDVYASCGHKPNSSLEGVWWKDDTRGWSYGVLCELCKVVFKASNVDPFEKEK